MESTLFAASVAVFLIGCKSDTPEDKAPEPGPAASQPDASAAVTFASVQTLLSQKCMPCHGENGKDGIDLRSYESVMKGGEHGAIVAPGDPASSVIVQALRGTNGKKQMPFKQAPLSEDQIKQVEDWIRAGAKA